MTTTTEDMLAEMEDIPPAPDTEDRLEKLQQLGRRVLGIDEQIAAYDERIKARKAVRREILEREMIDLLDAAKVSEVKVDGWVFAADDYYHASIKEENRDEAHDWLEAHEAGDIISNTVVVDFPKDFQEEALALERYVREHYQMAEVDRRRAVPWKRLASWVKDYVVRSRAVEPGEEPMEPLPLQLLGATVGRVVALKVPRKSKK